MLTAREVRQLDGLAFGSCEVSPASTSSGGRIARARGFGLEFQDFRHYQPGDDPRAIDWNTYARLQQLVVRVFRADGHLRVHLLVDTSGSMGVGTPDKLSCAKTMAALLCYIAVKRGDAVGVATFDNTIRHALAPAAGRPQLQRVFQLLDPAVASGRSDADRALFDYGGVVRGPGLVVVISDFFQDGGMFEGLRYLMHRGLTPAVVQVVASGELNPEFDDEVELVDAEDTHARPIVVDGGTIAAYREALLRLSADLAGFCLEHGLPCTRAESSFAFVQLLHACVRAGLLASQSGHP